MENRVVVSSCCCVTSRHTHTHTRHIVLSQTNLEEVVNLHHTTRTLPPKSKIGVKFYTTQTKKRPFGSKFGPNLLSPPTPIATHDLCFGLGNALAPEVVNGSRSFLRSSGSFFTLNSAIRV